MSDDNKTEAVPPFASVSGYSTGGFAMKYTVAEAMQDAADWSIGMTLHADSRGWRVAVMLLREEVLRLRKHQADARKAWLEQADRIDWIQDNEINTKIGYATQTARITTLRECAAALAVDESNNDGS